MRDHRPAVVLAGFRHVDFISAACAVFVQPQRTSLRMQRCPLGVAMAVTPDFRQYARAINERVVRRHAAISADANHLTEVG